MRTRPSPVVEAQDWRAVVLSPHFDDAALSVGGLLRRLEGPTAVVTVHGGPPRPGRSISDWDAACGFVSPEEAYEARLAEDARACALLCTDQIALPQADGPYSREPLTALDDFLRLLHPRTEVFIPLGTNQPDHAVVRDHALEALAAREPRPRIYADLPYTSVVPGWGSESASSMLATSHDFGRAYQKLQDQYGLDVLYDIRLDDDEWSCKRDAILCYASQLGTVATMGEVRPCGAILRHPGPLQTELIWEIGCAGRENRIHDDGHAAGGGSDLRARTPTTVTLWSSHRWNNRHAVPVSTFFRLSWDDDRPGQERSTKGS